MLVNIVKYRGIDRDKGRERERESEFSTIANFSVDCRVKKCLNQHLFRFISLSNTVIYLGILWCHYFCYGLL